MENGLHVSTLICGFRCLGANSLWFEDLLRNLADQLCGRHARSGLILQYLAEDQVALIALREVLSRPGIDLPLGRHRSLSLQILKVFVLSRPHRRQIWKDKCHTSASEQ